MTVILILRHTNGGVQSTLGLFISVAFGSIAIAMGKQKFEELFSTACILSWKERQTPL